MKKFLLLILMIFIQFAINIQGQNPLWQGKGRIIITSDGNEHDHDDWSATALSLAIIAANDLQSKLAVYVYSDHIWGSNTARQLTNGLTAWEQMRESALGGQKWFGFDKTKFLCGVDNAELAYNAITAQINESSSTDPLFIIEAGPMQVTGEAISRSNKDKLKYVTLITHSNWNNEHSDKPEGKWDVHTGWTYNQIKTKFTDPEKGGLKCMKILDQNGGSDYLGLRCERTYFDWIKTSPFRNKPPYKEGSWDWLYSRLETFVQCAGGTKFDASDAGMVVFLLTGIEKTNPEMVRKIMESHENK
jgi:hypothetical protein